LHYIVTRGIELKAIFKKSGPGGFYREALDGIRLASDERILEIIEFVEATLKKAGEFYE
jgi:hypothetical protein